MPKTSATPFALAESAIISLYNGGVLSPAVLERLLASFAKANPDWDTAPTERSVDGRSLHEVVALTMLPGESLRAARKSFMSVIEYIAGMAKTEKGSTKKATRRSSKDQDKEPEAEDDSADLATLLSGDAPANRRGGASRTRNTDASVRTPTAKAAFSPLLNAAAPRKGKR